MAAKVKVNEQVSVHDGAKGSSSSKKSTSSSSSSSGKLQTNVSVVDYLKSIGEDSSLSARKEIAKALGIDNYKGSGPQNTAMLNMLKSGNTGTTAPVAPVAPVTPPTTSGGGGTNPPVVPVVPVADAPITQSSGGGGGGYSSTYTMQPIDEQLALLMAQIPGLSNNYVRPDYTKVIDPTLKSAIELAELYGINYDKDYIQGIFDKAVQSEYGARYAQQDVIDRTYYDNLAANQNTAVDTIRQAQAQAIQSGASKGASVANQLSAVLGLSQMSADQATELAQARGLLAQEQGAAQAQAVKEGLSYYDNLGLTLGDLSKQLYSYDTQQMAAQLAYNQGINTDYAGVMAQDLASQAAYSSAIANATGGLIGGYNTNLSALEQAQIAANASMYNADQNLAGNRYVADQNLAAQQLIANAQSAGSLGAIQSAAQGTGTGTGTQTSAAPKENSYLNKVATAANNGASGAIINDMINQGLSNGQIKANQLAHSGNTTDVAGAKNYVYNEAVNQHNASKPTTAGLNVTLPANAGGNIGLSIGGKTLPTAKGNNYVDTNKQTSWVDTLGKYITAGLGNLTGSTLFKR